MAIVITYTCDNCGKSQQDNVQMWNIAVAVWHDRNPPPNLQYEVKDRQKLWCRHCVEEVGILPREKEKPTSPEPLAFEELIRQIIQDEIQNTRGAE